MVASARHWDSRRDVAIPGVCMIAFGIVGAALLGVV